MQSRSPSEPDPEHLSEPAAARLLKRASELDAARRAGSAVADLRAAAAEAGISTPAFDAALAELHGKANAPVPAAKTGRSRRTRTWALGTAIAVLVATGALVVSRLVLPADAALMSSAPILEESILLRCLSPGEAGELVRPLLRERGNLVVVNPSQAPRILTIRATAAQLTNVKAALEKYEGGGSAACSLPRATTPTP